MEHLIKLIEALAWPVTVLVLAFGFRTELQKVFNRISKLKYKEVEATFDKELSRVENHTKLYVQPEERLIAETSAEKSGYAQLLRLADVSPRAAVTEAWRNLESAVDQIAVSMGVDAKRPMSGARAIQTLIDKKQVDQSLLEDYDRLRKLRNQAVHAEEFDISQTEAERYAALAIEIATFIKRFTKET
jgi:hypothetical protein